MTHLYNQGDSHRGDFRQDLSKERRRLQAKHLWMEVKLSWHVLADRKNTAAPTGKSREQLYAAFQQGCQGQPKESLWRKSRPGTCTQSCPGMVGAMPRVDAVLQRSKCAIGPRPSGPSTGFPGQGRRCSCWGRGIYGILRKEVADKRGHLPAQATSTLAWCERPAWTRKCRSRHEGHLKLYMDGITTWWKRCYEGLREAVVSP